MRQSETNRAGTQALRLLAAPFNVYVLEALAYKPRSLLELRRAAGFPPETTMRGHMRLLKKTGILAAQQRDEFPGAVDVELAEAGHDLLRVNEVTHAWLATSPTGPIQPGSVAAKGAVKSLVEAWASNMMRALAARPLSLTELDSVISGLSYPSLERRLAAMRVAGQVQRQPGLRGAIPYAVTDWLRQATAPIVAAVRWERRHIRGKMVPVTPRDVEAAFLLSVPLLPVSTDFDGTCRMAVELRRPDKSIFSGVTVTVKGGRLVQCTSRLERDADASAVGSIEAWLSAVGDGEQRNLGFSGEAQLGSDLVESLHQTLFGTTVRADGPAGSGSFASMGSRL